MAIRKTCPDYSGFVYILYSTIANNDVQIEGNAIYLPDTAADNSYTYGMYLLNAESYYIAKDTVSNAAYTGIYTVGVTNNDTLDCNYVTGGESSIVTGGRYNYTIRCNTVDNSDIGFQFIGTNFGTFQANNFNHHTVGLMVDSSGVMGSQSHQGNLWNIKYRGTQLGAYDFAPSDVFIYYPPAGLNVPTTSSYTPSYSPLSLFQYNTLSPDQDCTTNDTCH